MNELHYCQNCGYLLVLIERRRKYKCSKCSRPYPIREIEDKTFRQWNKTQRILDIESQKPKKKSKLTEEEKRLLIKKWKENNKERVKKYQNNYYQNNKYRFKTYRKKYYRLNKNKLCEINNNNAKLNRDLHLKRCKKTT